MLALVVSIVAPQLTAAANVVTMIKPSSSGAKWTYMPGRIIVKYRKTGANAFNVSNLPDTMPKVSMMKTSNLSSVDKAVLKINDFTIKHKVALEDSFKNLNTVVYKFDTKVQKIDTLIANIIKDPSVEYAQKDFITRFTYPNTNDSAINRTYDLDNSGSFLSISGNVTATKGADAGAAKTWAMSGNTEGQGVLVGVIDTGVAYVHPDLKNNMWNGADCKSDTGTIISGGCPNHGYSYYYKSLGGNQYSPAEDNNPAANKYMYILELIYGPNQADIISAKSHGSHVSGIISAVKNNSVGVAGVAPQAKIVALQFDGVSSNELRAINFAIKNNVKIINASYSQGSFNQAEYDAIKAFGASGGLFIAAAGNEATNNDSKASYPCNYDLNNIICVAATDHNDKLANFSNYGAKSVDLSAPGTAIYSPIIKDLSDNGQKEAYEYFQGTSMATPVVVGAAALVWGYKPSLTNLQVKQLLMDNVDKLSVLSGKVVSGGRVNAYKAILSLAGSGSCGNGALDSGEVCDGSLLNNKTCKTEGFDSGTLACAIDCKSLITTGCTKTNLPDLLINNVELFTNIPSNSKALKITYTVNNKSKNLLFKISVTDSKSNYAVTKDVEYVVNNLDQNIFVIDIAPGDYSFKIKIDSNDSIAESDETNNIFEKNFVVDSSGLCIDTDGGINNYEKGATYMYGGAKSNDYCVDTNSQMEYWCAIASSYNEQYITIDSDSSLCEFGCLDGACKRASDQYCGDGKKNNDEQCDKTDLGGMTCATKGFDGGQLACSANCIFDTSGCTKNNPPTCVDTDGDNKTIKGSVSGIDPNGLTFVEWDKCSVGDMKNLTEYLCVPDGKDGKIKSTKSYACDYGCVDGACTTSPSTYCGDGIKNGTEECDKTQFGTETCLTKGFDEGALSCNSNCTINTSACTKKSIDNNETIGCVTPLSKISYLKSLGLTRNESILNYSKNYTAGSNAKRLEQVITAVFNQFGANGQVPNTQNDLVGKCTTMMRLNSDGTPGQYCYIYSSKLDEYGQTLAKVSAETDILCTDKPALVKAMIEAIKTGKCCNDSVECGVPLTKYPYLKDKGFTANDTIESLTRENNIEKLKVMIDGVYAEFGGGNADVPNTYTDNVGECRALRHWDGDKCYVYSDLAAYRRKVSAYTDTICGNPDTTTDNYLSVGNYGDNMQKDRMLKAVLANQCCAAKVATSNRRVAGVKLSAESNILGAQSARNGAINTVDYFMAQGTASTVNLNVYQRWQLISQFYSQNGRFPNSISDWQLILKD